MNLSEVIESVESYAEQSSFNPAPEWLGRIYKVYNRDHSDAQKSAQAAVFDQELSLESLQAYRAECVKAIDYACFKRLEKRINLAIKDASELL